MADILMKNIYKKYEDGVEAIRDFNLEVEDKEFVIFVGPSGCGKSTTLRMVAGIEEISDGELYIDGVRMNQVASCDRDIAMVFQNYALYPHMNVYENISYSMRLKKMPKEEIKMKVEEVAKVLGLEQILKRKPKELSGGQKQRVAIGRAMVRNPKVFLMDEPLSNLDAKLRNQMRTELLRLHKELEATIIYVTHDQVEAMTLGTKIVVLKDGEIMQVASPEVLYNQPRNLFVAGFIGTPSMNFFQTTCVALNNEIHLKMGDDSVYLPGALGGSLANKGFLDRKITIGVRPEHMKIRKRTGEQCHGVIEVFEMHGAESVAYFAYQGNTYAAKLPNDTDWKRGDEVEFYFDLDAMHLFDGYYENRIELE